MDEQLKNEVNQAVSVLRSGGIILYPTDTVWGIGCDATNADAVERIYRLKQKKEAKSMLVLVDSIDKISLYADHIPQVAWDLLELADKPLTLILPKAKKVAENLVPPEGTLGIRVPKHDFCIALAKKLGRPIVSTSANLTGTPAPARFTQVSDEIKEGVDHIVDSKYEAGATGAPSSIIQLNESSEVKILRP